MSFFYENRASETVTTQEAVGPAMASPEVIDCIWHNRCHLKAPGGDQLAAKEGQINVIDLRQIIELAHLLRMKE